MISQPLFHQVPPGKTDDDDRLAFNGTFSTNRLYRAFDKDVAVKKVKLITET